ncbi:MAG: amidohydrolase family protein [Minisyncoccia bacterium]|jgi:N-acyl-D-aspartate/D-glutamate deacylase
MTLLIKNVRILGGSRPFPDSSDVFVSGDKISAIGNFPNKKADVVMDGQDAYLSPGFIDVNTDSDHYLTLFEHPGQEDFLKQGVTTILGGMCGSSLAPLLYGTLESVSKWGDPNRVNVNWHAMGEFLRVLDRRPLGVNFGTLVGHATIRRAILGEDLRDLTKNELDVFSQTLTAALEEGAFGVSTGLAYVHVRNTSYAELKSLVGIAKKFHGVYATHLRNPSKGIAASVEETINLAKETGVKTLVSHFVPVVGSEEEYETALAAIEALPDDMDFHFDIYPSSSSLLPIYTFLPLWAQNGGVDVMLANVKDEWLAARIRKDMPHLDEEHFVIAQAPGNDFLVGKSLKEVKHMYGFTDGRDALIRLMVTMNMRGGVLYRNLASHLTKRAMASKRSFIASNAPSFTDSAAPGRQLKSERTTSTFTKFLAMVEQEHLMPLEEAITKITAAPAKKFDLALRGTVTEGNFADLVCFKSDEIKFTIVNGKVAMHNGACAQMFAGKVLRHKP